MILIDRHQNILGSHPAWISGAYQALTEFATMNLQQAVASGAKLDNTILTLSKYGIVAGSSVAAMFNGQEYNDYDVFFTGSEQFANLFNALQTNSSKDPSEGVLCGYRLMDSIVSHDNNAMHAHISKLHTISFQARGKKAIQLVKTNWYTNARHVIAAFDFTACQFAIADGTIYLSASGALDAVAKRVVLTGIRNQLPVTLSRMLRYAKKGYMIPAATFMALGVDVNNEEDNGISLISGVVSTYDEVAGVNLDEDA